MNSSAAFALTVVCAKAMKEKGWGKIINFTSVTLKGILDGYVPYVASKGAMLGLTKSLARELGPYGISVNAVAPGAIVSEAEARVFGHKAAEYNQWVLNQQCLKKRIEPEDVAELVHLPGVARIRHDQRPEHSNRRRLVVPAMRGETIRLDDGHARLTVCGTKAAPSCGMTPCRRGGRRCR